MLCNIDTQSFTLETASDQWPCVGLHYSAFMHEAITKVSVLWSQCDRFRLLASACVVELIYNNYNKILINRHYASYQKSLPEAFAATSESNGQQNTTVFSISLSQIRSQSKYLWSLIGSLTCLVNVSTVSLTERLRDVLQCGKVWKREMLTIRYVAVTSFG